MASVLAAVVAVQGVPTHCACDGAATVIRVITLPITRRWRLELFIVPSM